MHRLRTAAQQRIASIVRTRGHEPMFHIVMAGLLVLWAVAWLVVADVLHHQAAGAPAPARTLVSCVPSTDMADGSLLRCIVDVSARRVDSI
ncbi:MAG TPA: hypothetical protein VE631_05595 [Alphaproteobacteria bacterium]|nr:hypothetical protein [Alphaproteobacteria bacterium]